MLNYAYLNKWYLFNIILIHSLLQQALTNFFFNTDFVPAVVLGEITVKILQQRAKIMQIIKTCTEINKTDITASIYF